mmetsp:Transcript_3351/g.7353  ORF Transcript_3351/g.7353 Transcript_3351/m.7353 type:complete len:287 (-) Transcript_3351:553-1413(-)
MALNLKTLKLMNCGIDKQSVPVLCEFTRNRLHRLNELCLRQNFTLDGGYHELFSLPRIKSLDLSLCDLDENDGFVIKQAIEKGENKDLKELNLSGNYRLTTAVPGIIRAGSVRLTDMDCSFCGVSNSSQQLVFDILAGAPSSSSPPPLAYERKKCTIRSLRMQGTIFKNIDGLIRCIGNNKSLRSIVIDHSHAMCKIDSESLKTLVAALQSNYYLQVLKYDTVYNQCLGGLEDIDFWLKLNRCGRRVLLQTNEEFDSWSYILTQGGTSNDHNIVFWLLKHGSAMFT